MWLPSGLLGAPPLLVLKAPKARGRGIWLPQPGRCCRQLEAQQAKVMDWLSLREPGERKLPCPALRAEAKRP